MQDARCQCQRQRLFYYLFPNAIWGRVAWTLINPYWLLKSSPVALIVGFRFCVVAPAVAQVSGQRQCQTFTDHHLSNEFTDAKAHSLHANTLYRTYRFRYIDIKSREIIHLSKNERFLSHSWTKTNRWSDMLLIAPRGWIESNFIWFHCFALATGTTFWCWCSADGIIGHWNKQINAAIETHTQLDIRCARDGHFSILLEKQ